VGAFMKKHLLTTLVLCLSLFSNAVWPKSHNAKDTIRNEVNVISKMIKAVQPNLDLEARNRIAYSLYATTKKYNVDPKIMIAIIGTESDFRNEKVSSTGDLSLAQINPVVWNKEFERMGMDKLNQKRLKKDEVYALSKMAEILTILKVRHAKKDAKWFARYHSHTKKYKHQYSVKVEKRLRMIASIQVASNN
jgi:hypothetical protein